MQLKINKQSQSVWHFEGQMTTTTIADNWEVLAQGRPETGVWNLNFDQVTHMDSAGLAFLLDCLRHADAQGVKIQLSVLPHLVKQLIKVQGVGPLLDPHIKMEKKK
jgi:anti-anti-sigma factor